MSKNDLTKKETNALSVDVMEFGDFGTDNVISTDLRIPKILLAQAMSSKYLEEGGKIYDIYESFEKKKLGDKENPVKIIPFFNTNAWFITKKNDKGKFDFYSIEDRGGLDTRREYHFTHEDGTPGTQTKVMNIFCLLKNGSSNIPFMISLRNFSFKFGAQSYVDKLTLLKGEKKSPAHVSWDLISKVYEHNGDKFGIFDLDFSRNKDGKKIENSYDEVKAAFEAYKSMKAAFDSGVKVDMSEDKEEVEIKDEKVPF